jgi:hypothetical protein
MATNPTVHGYLKFLILDDKNERKCLSISELHSYISIQLQGSHHCTKFSMYCIIWKADKNTAWDVWHYSNILDDLYVQENQSAEFEVLVVVTVKSTVFWLVTSEKALCFGGTHILHLQGWRVSHTRNHLRLPFDPDDGGDTFLWNERLSPNYVMLQLRRLYSS